MALAGLIAACPARGGRASAAIGLDWLLGSWAYHGPGSWCAPVPDASSENRGLLVASRAEARTDPLTGLGNRRQLIEDLSRREPRGRSPVLFALFDLDGFKAYNDSFGHPAGDALLAEIGREPRGRGRSGGPRLPARRRRVLHPRPRRAGRAASRSPRLPGRALRTGRGLHDRQLLGVGLRSRRRPRRRRRPAASRTGGCTRQKSRPPALARAPDAQRAAARAPEREPELGEHLAGGRASWRVALGQAIDSSRSELDEVARAAELHDIGKIGVPDAILHKRGAAQQSEWELMRNHTRDRRADPLAAPAMAPVARLVRSTPRALGRRWLSRRPRAETRSRSARG